LFKGIMPLLGQLKKRLELFCFSSIVKQWIMIDVGVSNLQNSFTTKLTKWQSRNK